jgi:indole-3-glycerol phosphate synthase
MTDPDKITPQDLEASRPRIDILEKIVADKRPEIQALKAEKNLGDFMKEALDTPRTRDFQKALVNAHRVTVIAELKKASPSKGVLREDFHPVEIAQAYQKGGAVALSVLTEKNYFQGDPAFLSQVRTSTNLPLLRKDFIVDEIQIPESRVLGADAILLIAAILEDDQVRRFLDLAKQLHLAALCEVHDAAEMERMVACGAGLIGINNRNLRNFEVDLQTTFDLVPLAPEDTVLVSESGIRGYADLELMRDVGVAAVLVGETLMRQEDPSKALKNLYDPNSPVPLFD